MRKFVFSVVFIVVTACLPMLTTGCAGHNRLYVGVSTNGIGGAYKTLNSTNAFKLTVPVNIQGVMQSLITSGDF